MSNSEALIWIHILFFLESLQVPGDENILSHDIESVLVLEVEEVMVQSEPKEENSVNQDSESVSERICDEDTRDRAVGIRGAEGTIAFKGPWITTRPSRSSDLDLNDIPFISESSEK